MPYPAPVRICPVDEEVLYSSTNSQYNVRPNAVATENYPVNRVTTYRYGGKLWQVCFDPYGDTNDVTPGPGYYHLITFINYSTNNGATWTPAGSSLRIIAGRDFTDNQAITVLVGSRIYLFHTITEWTGPTAGVYSGQRRWVRVDYFDCDTLAWSSDVATNSGPEMTWADGSFMSPDNYVNLSMAVDRGSGVLVIGHDEAQSSSSVQAGVYSIFDTSTFAWGSINVKVFDFTVAISGWSGISQVLFDGTHTHFWSSATLSGGYGRLHRTLSSSDVLGTTTDLYSGYPGAPSFPSSFGGGTGALPDTECFATSFGGEVILVSHCRRGDGTYPSQPWFRNYNIVVWRCPSATQNPTWSTWGLTGSTDWDFALTGYGDATYPFLVENGGSLYLGFGTKCAYDTSTDVRFHIRFQKYLGSGSWDPAVIAWDYKDWAGFNPSGTMPENTVVKYSPIGNNGTAGTDGINWAASFNQSAYPALPAGGDSVYWFGYIPSSCCCANIAY